MDVMELKQKVDNNCDGRRSTDDIGQFITLSVHLYAPEAARRAGPSASANTCIRPIPEIYQEVLPVCNVPLSDVTGSIFLCAKLPVSAVYSVFTVIGTNSAPVATIK